MVKMFMVIKKKITKWGNSVSVRIPIEYLNHLKLKEGEEVNVILDGNEIRIRKIM